MRKLVAGNDNQPRYRRRLRGLLKKTDGIVRIASAHVMNRDPLIFIKNRKIRLLTSLLPMDTASDATSFEILGALIESGVECRSISADTRLYAKVYILGDASAMVIYDANLIASTVESSVVRNLSEWFDVLWEMAQPLTISQLTDSKQQVTTLRRDYVKLKKKTSAKLHLPKESLPPDVLSDDLRNLLDHANHFFVCNTDRRQGDRTHTGGYAIEQDMHNRGYATAWETFRFPSHIQQVEPGDAIFMFAKGIGIIGIGQAKTKCETLKPNDPDRIGEFYDSNTPEWRVPVQWLAWRNDEDAYPYKAPNFTFWNVTGARYRNLRKHVINHFLSDS